MENDELNEYRTRLLIQVEKLADDFCTACQAADNPFQPVEDGGWNVHQIAAHVRDVQAQVYGTRIRRSVEEDVPVFDNFDGERWQAEHYVADEPLADILESFMSDIRQIVPWLKKCPSSDWSRASRHVVYGEFAMQHWVERMLAHIKEHLITVEKVKQV